MPINLTTPFTWPNGTRLVIDRVRLDEEDLIMTVVIQLRTPGVSNHVGAEKTISIRNGTCDRISRNATPGDLMRWDDWIVFEPRALNVPTGYDAAANAWKAGANPAARRVALEAHLLSVGYIHASLTGT